MSTQTLNIMLRIDSKSNRVPPCTVTVSTSPTYIFPTTYDYGIYIKKSTTIDGITYYINAEFESIDEDLQPTWAMEDFNKDRALQILFSPGPLLPDGLQERSKKAITPKCNSFHDVVDGKFCWFLLVDVPVTTDGIPASGGTLEGAM